MYIPEFWRGVGATVIAEIVGFVLLMICVGWRKK